MQNVLKASLDSHKLLTGLIAKSHSSQRYLTNLTGEIVGTPTPWRLLRRYYPAMSKLRQVILLFLLHSVALVSAQGSTNGTSSWQTLNGKVHSLFLCLVAEKAEGKGNDRE